MDIPRLDRAAQLRSKPAGEDALRDDEALVLPLWRGRVLLDGGDPPAPLLLRRAELASLIEGQPLVFLGQDGGQAHLAAALPADKETPEHDALRGRGQFADLRMSGSLLSRQDYRLLAYARGILQWHRSHARCARCGGDTLIAESGHVRVCKPCDTRHFPRTDPAIMAMIIYDDRILLARQPSWPPGFMSVLAGFVEPGESLEQAVAREVHEEVGLTVTNIRYIASQPWPFPASLMIGFAMEATGDQIVLDEEELSAGAFFTRQQVREQKDVVVPPRVSLAHQLISRFLDGNL